MEQEKMRSIEPPKYLTWLNTALLLILLPLTAINSCSKPETVVLGNSSTSVVIGDDIEDALQSADALITSGDFSGAFDMLLVGSRLAPSDPALFDLVTRFVEEATASKSEDALAMAEDLLDRCDSLVYFQRTHSVRSARKRLDELRATFQANEPPLVAPSPLDDVRRLIKLAGDSDQARQVRSRAAEQARLLLDDVGLQTALGEGPGTAATTPAAIAELYVEVDKLEQQYIESLFEDIKPRITKWQSESSSIIKQAEAASNADAPGIGRLLGKTADSGYGLLQELMPYSKSEIPSASDLSKSVESTVTELQRQKNWLYNKQALARIREIEAAKSQSPEDRIGYLAEIHEEQLSPYVLQRHNEVWEKVFEELPHDDAKVNAVRMRILRKNR